MQYGLLIRLSKSIPEVLAAPMDATSQAEPAISQSNITTPTAAGTTAVDLEPELRIIPSTSGNVRWTSLDLVVAVETIKLHLYDGGAITEANLKEHGIARFALNDNTLRFKLLSDGAGEAQVVLRSFTMSNTRSGNSKFREIIPAAQHDRNQFMVLYTMSGGANSTSLAILTIDSPQIIFAVDPVIALLGFFTSAFVNQSSQDPHEEFIAENEPSQPPSGGKLDFRVDLHDLSVSVLENDADPDSQSIKLSVNHILLSQQVKRLFGILSLHGFILLQGIMALSIKRLGMSLMRMGEISESVRFLDDVDLTFSLDSRSSSSQQMTSMEIAVKPIVFRASYGDINMISSIVNKAISLYGNSQNTSAHQDDIMSTSMISKPSEGYSKSAASRSRRHTVGNARVLMSKEQVSSTLGNKGTLIMNVIFS